MIVELLLPETNPGLLLEIEPGVLLEIVGKFQKVGVLFDAVGQKVKVVRHETICWDLEMACLRAFLEMVKMLDHSRRVQ
jgi:hypothetical protein